MKALRAAGVEITLEEVVHIGRSVTGRPHFARVLIKKGYATDYRDAFRRFLGEDAPTYVEHESPDTEVVIAEVLAGGGLPVVPHPVRLMFPDQLSERQAIEKLQRAGLGQLEVYHSDHLSRARGLLPRDGEVARPGSHRWSRISMARPNRMLPWAPAGTTCEFPQEFLLQCATSAQPRARVDRQVRTVIY